MAGPLGVCWTSLSSLYLWCAMSTNLNKFPPDPAFFKPRSKILILLYVVSKLMQKISGFHSKTARYYVSKINMQTYHTIGTNYIEISSRSRPFVQLQRFFGTAGALQQGCTPSYLSTGILNLLQPAQAEVVLGQSFIQPQLHYIHLHVCTKRTLCAVHVYVLHSTFRTISLDQKQVKFQIALDGYKSQTPSFYAIRKYFVKKPVDHHRNMIGVTVA